MFRGTIGPYRIGAELDVADKVRFVGGFYYYASALKDIPLGGSVVGSDLKATEPNGGTFDLHFVDNAKRSDGLTFYTSTGLVGTWSKGTTTYPVHLEGGFSFVGAPGREYAGVTTAPAPNFEAMVRRFVAGVVAGDRAETAATIHFPLRINVSDTRAFTVATASALESDWDRIFTPAYVAKVRTVIPHQLFTRDGQAMIGDGEAWFDARGVVAINLPRAR